MTESTVSKTTTRKTAAAKTAAPAPAAPAAPEGDGRITIRVDMVVKVDPARWTSQGPAVDVSAVAEKLAEAGLPAEAAMQEAQRIAQRQTAGVSKVRADVRRAVLSAVEGIDEVKDSGAEVAFRV